MKKDIWLLMVLLMGLSSACSQHAEPETSDSEFQILIMVNQMVGEEETTRTYGSMTPDRENSIKSLSVFQFDMEGELRTLDNGKRYIFQTFTGLGDPNGIPRVTNADMPDLVHVQTGERMYTCLIANIEETLLRETLFPRGEDDPVTWTEFRAVEFAMPFADKTNIAMDQTLEPGHLTTTYMFGYYDGDVPPTGFTIGLGRILTRLKINFNVDAATITEGMKFYVALENLETHAYFSVAEDSPHQHYTDPRPRLLDSDKFDLTTNGVAAGKSILQFYCAPHVGSRISADNCTCLYLWCVKKDIRAQGDDESDEAYNAYVNGQLPKSSAAKIPLCADYDNGQYQLARNTFYSFNVRLKTPSGSSDSGGYSGSD